MLEQIKKKLSVISIKCKLWCARFIWQRTSVLHIMLLPISYIFYVVIVIRIWLYKHSYFKKEKFPVPIIVVGNISIGGSGKTPLVIWIVKYLIKKHYKPGVAMRGYGGSSSSYPMSLSDASDVKEVGDEAMLIYKTVNCPVVIDSNRPRAVKTILSEHDCNIIICDDGLQHYALERDIEVIVIDGQRKFGNGRLLPAGPLREPISRIKPNSLIINNDITVITDTPSMSLTLKKLHNLSDPNTIKSLSSIKNKHIWLVTAIGNPNRLIDTLNGLTEKLDCRIFPDHHSFSINDFEGLSKEMIIMTEKDSVKCMSLSLANAWYIETKLEVSKPFIDNLMDRIKSQ